MREYLNELKNGVEVRYHGFYQHQFHQWDLHVWRDVGSLAHAGDHILEDSCDVVETGGHQVWGHRML